MHSGNSCHRRGFTTLAALTVLLGFAGCGSRGYYPVSGRVTFADGSPLDEGIVICETQNGDKTVMARGTLQRDGTFQLGTLQPRDGAPPGKYRVLVVARALSEREKEAKKPPVIDPKFEKFETSGLKLEVKEGSDDLMITVTKPPEGRP
jgi:hypothetical protein